MADVKMLHPNLAQKNYRIFESIRKGLKEGDIRVSRKGTPHLVIREYYSVVRFGNKVIRVFDRYMMFDEKQKHVDFTQWPQVVSYLEKRLQEDIEQKSGHVVSMLNAKRTLQEA